MTSTRKLLLAILAFALAYAARADEEFIYTGSMATYTVPTTGTYEIFAAGAQGGYGRGSGSGGYGAILMGDINLSAGTVLDIVVGGQGGSGFSDLGAGGGGGGSFVFEPGALLPLIVAGGGGGGGYYENGGAGQTGTPGENGFGGTNEGAGGTGGQGGTGGRTVFSGTGYNGGGGGGWLGNGTAGAGSGSGNGGSGAPTFAGAIGNLSSGPTPGGYGGGGGGGSDSGGGGGGYSGGGGGSRDLITGGGGGGGSYLDTSFSDTTLIAGGRAGNGDVKIAFIPAPVPEPRAILLLGSILIGLAGTLKRRISG